MDNKWDYMKRSYNRCHITNLLFTWKEWEQLDLCSQPAYLCFLSFNGAIFPQNMYECVDTLSGELFLHRVVIFRNLTFRVCTKWTRNPFTMMLSTLASNIRWPNIITDTISWNTFTFRCNKLSGINFFFVYLYIYIRIVECFLLIDLCEIHLWPLQTDCQTHLATSP